MEFDPIHPEGTIARHLDQSCLVGEIHDTETTSLQDSRPVMQQNQAVNLHRLLNLDDIEEAAKQIISQAGWAYYYSGSSDLVTKSLNSAAFRSILFKPRILRDVSRCDLSTTLLGHPVGSAIFVAPAARGRLAHPAGERGIAEGVSTFPAVQIISNHASQTPRQIVQGLPAAQIFGWQLYVQRDRRKSEESIAQVTCLPQIKFIVLTTDVASLGRREMEERLLPDGVDIDVPNIRDLGGVDSGLTGGKASDMKWETTIPWLARQTELPIIVKGIQTWQDALLAARFVPQVKGIIISNHGGRALDTAAPPLHVLLEIHQNCPTIFQKIEVWVDGGIRRGSDVVKALCLGARAVGIGRAPLYGLAVGGKAGVKRTFDILHWEMRNSMSLLGVSNVAQLDGSHVNTSILKRDLVDSLDSTPSSKQHVKSLL